jgi:molybdate transport system substrate-binding protein
MTLSPAAICDEGNMTFLRILHFAVFIFWLPLLSSAETIKVAVAANFSSTMKELVANFEKSSGHTVDLSFASTGKIYAQIYNGAPYHAFFSADQAAPEKLENEGKAIPGTRFSYAIGTLVLWSAKSDLTDEPLNILKSGRFNKLALANPKLAPYGAAAVEVLDQLNLTAGSRAKWVLGENIAQTFQFVFTENADLGFIAGAQLQDKGKLRKGSFWVVPDELHAPIYQDAQLLLAGKNSAATQQLLHFIRSAPAQAIIHSHGYKTPGIE